MRTFLKLFALFALVFACIKLAYHKPAQSKPKFDSASIVRLYNLRGQFFCSGVVISQHEVITAGHCVIATLGPMAPLGIYTQPEQIEIREADGVPTGRLAIAKGWSPQMDTGVFQLSNSMQDHAIAQVTVEPDASEKALGHRLLSCGFPFGGPLHCVLLTHAHHYDFGWRVIGSLWPGMSGGPVIDLDTGEVVAINSAVNGIWSAVAPLVNIYDQLNIPKED